MYHRPKKTPITKILSSKVFLIVSLLVLAGVSFGLFKITYRRIQAKKEITAIEKKIRFLESNNLKLVHLLDYLNTSDYQEKTARVELGFKKPDEKVIVITKESGEDRLDLAAELSAEEKSAESKISNPKKWWQYFFKN